MGGEGVDEGGGGGRWSGRALVVGSREGDVPSGQVLAGRFNSCVLSEPAYPINALRTAQTLRTMPSTATSTPGRAEQQAEAGAVLCSAAEVGARHAVDTRVGAGRTIIASQALARCRLTTRVLAR